MAIDIFKRVNITDLIDKFRSASDGSFTIQSVIILLPILIIVGGTFDFAQLVDGKNRLQNVADIAALTAVTGTHTDSEREEVFGNIVNKVIDPKWGLKNVSHTVTIIKDGRNIKVQGTLSAEKDMFSLHYIKPSRRFSVETEAVYGIKDVELVLVLDISSSMRGSRISEAKVAAKDFIEKLLTKPSLKGHVDISIVPFGGTVKVPQSMSNMVAKQSKLTDVRFKKHWLGNSWNGCFELSPSNLTTEIKPSNQYNTIPDFYSWNKNNPWCPKGGSEFLPLTDNKNLLKDKINQLTLSDGTGTDHGLAWARANLSEEWKGKLPDNKPHLPRIVGPETQKIIVLMTDGGVTGQHYVRDQDMRGKLPYYSRKRARVSGSQAWDTFTNLCNSIKQDDGTTIITIAYLINNISHKNKLKACASSQKDYDSKSGELSNIFDDILDNITPVRLSN